MSNQVSCSMFVVKRTKWRLHCAAPTSMNTCSVDNFLQTYTPARIVRRSVITCTVYFKNVFAGIFGGTAPYTAYTALLCTECNMQHLTVTVFN